MEGNLPENSGTGLPTDHMDLRKHKIGNNEGPTTELGLAMGSTNKCTQPESSNNLDAGANAGSKADMTFVATNSLSELVWSPHRGLSVKCADCDLTEKKSFLWGMDSSNIACSPPPSLTVRETNSDEAIAGGGLEASQMGRHLDSQTSDKLAFVQSPSSTKDIMPLYRTTSHELGSIGEMKEFTNKMEKSVIDINHEYDDDHLDKKEKGICSPTHTSQLRRNTSSSILGNNSKSVSVNGRNVEPSLDLARANMECGRFREGTSSNPVKGNREAGSRRSHTAGMDGVSAFEISATKQCISDPPMPIVTAPDCKHEGFALVIKEGSNKSPTRSSDAPNLKKRECTSENYLQPQKVEGVRVEARIASGPEDVDGFRQDEGILPRGEVASDEASPNNRKICLYQRKDKDTVLSITEADGGTIKIEDDSHGSAESCNSRGTCLAGKRPWSCGQLFGNKKMKKQSHESPQNASLQRHDSSFSKWILNMVNPNATPLNIISRPSHVHESNVQPLVLKGGNKQFGHPNTGFETMFKALYSPRMNIQASENLNHDLQSKEGSGELRLAIKAYDKSNSALACGEGNDELSKESGISTKKGDGEGPSDLPSIPSANVPQEDPRIITAENYKSFNIACGLRKGGGSSSNSTFRNASDSPSEGKDAYKPNLIDSNKSLDSMNDRSLPPESLWITRFSPKVSGLMISSSQWNKNLGAPVEGPTDGVRISSPSENCVGLIKEHNIYEDFREPSAEDRVDVVNKKLPICVAKSVGSFGSIRIAEHTDQKFKCKVNPIQPSQRFKTSEAMASVFARRLDALRHIMPFEVSGNASQATTTCFFCGIRGHKLQDCSEITETELEDLLKKINSYDGAEKLCCFCIRCFQLNHWAIQCPNTYSRRSHSDDSVSLLDLRSSGKMIQIPGHERKGRGSPIALKVSDGKKPMVEARFTGGTSVSQKFNDMMILNESGSNPKLTKKDLLGNDFCRGTSRELIINEKQSKTSSSSKNESKEIQISAFCNFVNKQIPAVPREIFEAIKRLRLSRLDIIKCMNFPGSLSCLEGFYLRLRLRKWEEELGGTGYYVARINGVLTERSSGSSKNPLSVNIGGFKCLVESRFVSNQDFMEDELTAWWCSTLKCGGKLPSEERLKMKFEERKNFGF